MISPGEQQFKFPYAKMAYIRSPENPATACGEAGRAASKSLGGRRIRVGCAILHCCEVQSDHGLLSQF